MSAAAAGLGRAQCHLSIEVGGSCWVWGILILYFHSATPSWHIDFWLRLLLAAASSVMKRSRSLSSLPESSGYKRRKPSAASSRFAPIPGPSRKRVSQGAAPAIAGAEAHASPTSDHSRKSGRLSDRAYLNWKEVFTQDHQQQQQQQQAAAAGKGTSSHPGVARPVAGKNQKSQTSRHTLNQADARQLIPEAGRSLASELDAAHDHFQRNLQDRLAFRT